MPPLLDGTHDGAQISAVLPKDPFAILRPDSQADFRSNPANRLRQAWLENRTPDWTQKAPTMLIHCRGDAVAILAEAEVAYQSFTNRGACCVSVVDPSAPERSRHEDCYVPSLREVLSWFATCSP